MGRFERNDNDATRLPETLGVATEGLRSTIELEVSRIVESAEARASRIEDEALEKASRIEQVSQGRLAEVLEDSRARVEQLLARIDAAEASLGESVRALRSQAGQISGELARVGAEPFLADEPSPPEEAAPAAPSPEEPADEAAEARSEAASATPADPEVRELIRQQLATLAEGGRTRADAERMLLRFRQGEQYFDLLDEIYPESPPPKRGLLRRRKEAT